ncbi:serine decarboxylase-like [Silene latifolia]|uniref:serine decarboxylase-like n=1 Tax=Silene latifolia TaxID=37657 RepID=UPI003D771C6F
MGKTAESQVGSKSEDANEMVMNGDMQSECYDIVEPEANNGSELTRYSDTRITSVFTSFKQSLQNTKLNLGYGLNLEYDYSALDDLSSHLINNFGDPFMGSKFHGNSKKFEVAVLDWFARLWEIEKDEYWGYVTNGGSEGILHGIFLGREMFPEGVLYLSKESHFSVFKAARICRMKCITIDTLFSGEIDCAHLKTELLQNKDKPAVINVNLGTSLKGAIDDIDLVLQTLQECGFQQDRFYIHCDGSTCGFMLPLLQEVVPKITFKKPIGSISICGHKFIGCPVPCGIQMTRMKHIKYLSMNVEYISSRDCTITCSRSGHAPIYLWYILSCKGYKGFEHDFRKCIRNANYLKDVIYKAGVSVMLNNFSFTLVIERPPDEDFVRRWQLACEGDLARVAIMPSDSIEKLDTFYRELVKSRSSWIENRGYQPYCVAPQIGRDNCVCAIHK